MLQEAFILESMQKKQSYIAQLIAVILLLAAAGILLIAARRLPGFAQWYSVTVYPLLVGSIGRICGLVSFSVAEILCIMIPALVIIDLVISAIRNRFAGAFIRFLLTVSVLFFLYAACCGVNYYREPFVSRDVIKTAEISENELAEFCGYIADRINESYEAAVIDKPVSDNTSMLFSSYPYGNELASMAVSAMQALNDERLSGYYPQPKELRILSGVFSSMGVSGIYSPFTIEANVNGLMPGLEMPFTACHELSHLRGFMNEGEANYIGWLACINSDEEAFRRSGWLIAWIYAGGALHRTDPELFSKIYIRLPAAAVSELKENNAFWKSHETRASDIQDKVNDAYLKSNGQDQGVQTYGQLTTLMLIWFNTHY